MFVSGENGASFIKGAFCTIVETCCTLLSTPVRQSQVSILPLSLYEVCTTVSDWSFI